MCSKLDLKNIRNLKNLSVLVFRKFSKFHGQVQNYKNCSSDRFKQTCFPVKKFEHLATKLRCRVNCFRQSNTVVPLVACYEANSTSFFEHNDSNKRWLYLGTRKHHKFSRHIHNLQELYYYFSIICLSDFNFLGWRYQQAKSERFCLDNHRWVPTELLVHL